LSITLDRQVVSRRCAACECDFTVVRGSVHESGEGIGLYLIALHGHAGDARLAHLAVALLDESGDTPTAAAMEVLAMPDEFAYSLVDWEASPWRSEAYLGTMLDAAAARASPQRAAFLHVAEHVTRDIPEVRAYFA
jgi:hypothetical protein